MCSCLSYLPPLYNQGIIYSCNVLMYEGQEPPQMNNMYSLYQKKLRWFVKINLEVIFSLVILIFLMEWPKVIEILLANLVYKDRQAIGFCL